MAYGDFGRAQQFREGEGLFKKVGTKLSQRRAIKEGEKPPAQTIVVKTSQGKISTTPSLLRQKSSEMSSRPTERIYKSEMVKPEGEKTSREAVVEYKVTTGTPHRSKEGWEKVGHTDVDYSKAKRGPAGKPKRTVSKWVQMRQGVHDLKKGSTAFNRPDNFRGPEGKKNKLKNKYGFGYYPGEAEGGVEEGSDSGGMGGIGKKALLTLMGVGATYFGSEVLRTQRERLQQQIDVDKANKKANPMSNPSYEASKKQK